MNEGVVNLSDLIEDPTQVFAVGFQKTATTSLAFMLYTLGYRMDGFFSLDEVPPGTEVAEYAIDRARHVDAVQDMPWPVFFRELDEAYPGSKFILTTRPADRWIDSVVTHFGSKRIPTHEWIYGVPDAAGHRDAYVERYQRHNREVEEYFTGRSADLLVIDLTTGDGWAQISEFLGHVVPDDLPPPQANAAASRSRGRLLRRARSLLVRTGIVPKSKTPAAVVTAWDHGQTFSRRIDAVRAVSEGAVSSEFSEVANDALIDLRRRLGVFLGELEPGLDVDALSLDTQQLLVRRWYGTLWDGGFDQRPDDGPTDRERLRQIEGSLTEWADQFIADARRRDVDVVWGEQLALRDSR